MPVLQVRYGGKLESPGKSMARTWVYSHIPRWALYTMYHVVIASRDCGDIRFLLSLGVHADHIIACDLDPVAREEAAKFGVIVSPHPDIVATAKWACDAYPVFSINVDLCCSLLDAAPIVAEALKVRAPLTMLTYRRGRDRTVLDMCTSDVSSDEKRMAYLKRWTEMEPDAQETYHSFTRISQGSAMGVCMWTQNAKPGRKVKKARQYLCHACNAMGPHPMTHRKVCLAR